MQRFTHRLAPFGLRPQPPTPRQVAASFFGAWSLGNLGGLHGLGGELLPEVMFQNPNAERDFTQGTKLRTGQFVSVPEAVASAAAALKWAAKAVDAEEVGGGNLSTLAQNFQKDAQALAEKLDQLERYPGQFERNLPHEEAYHQALVALRDRVIRYVNEERAMRAWIATQVAAIAQKQEQQAKQEAEAKARAGAKFSRVANVFARIQAQLPLAPPQPPPPPSIGEKLKKHSGLVIGITAGVVVTGAVVIALLRR